jgi:transcriptional regulator with XRE-family HTH domain
MTIENFLQQRTSYDIQLTIRDRFRLRRKEQKVSQQTLAERADVSLGSLKRFEASGEISLTSLIKLAFALGYESDFDSLLAQRHYQSIEDVIDDAGH